MAVKEPQGLQVK